MEEKRPDGQLEFLEMILSAWPSFTKECGSCKAFIAKAWTKGAHFATAGECHRYAPTPNLNPDVLWPRVMASDSCLEYDEDAGKKKTSEAKRLDVQRAISRSKPPVQTPEEAAKEPAKEAPKTTENANQKDKW